MRERWYRAHNGVTEARPALAGSLVYFGTGEGRVLARDRSTGDVVWSGLVATGGSVDGANLLVGAGTVVAPVVTHLMGLDAATGRERWRYFPPLDTVGAGNQPQPGQVVMSYVDADGATVFIPAWGASVSAIDLQSGAVRWVWQPGPTAGDTAQSGVFRSGASGVRVSGDTVFVLAWHSLDRLGLTSEAWVIALARATGAELWRVTLPGGNGAWSSGAPAVAGDFVVAAANGGHAWGIDRRTQQVAWHFVPQTRWGTSAQVEVSGDTAYVDGGDGWLYALRATDGTVLWKTEVGNTTTTNLLVTPRRVYYPNGGTLYVFDRARGQRVTALRVRTTGEIFESPAAYADGRVFVTISSAAWSFDEP